MLYKTIVEYVTGINVLLEKFNSIKSNQNNQEEIEQLIKKLNFKIYHVRLYEFSRHLKRI